MVVSRLAMAALCAALIPSAYAGIEITVAAPLKPHVSLQAIIAVGTTSACGTREAPHLIEHLLLSGTAYGETPVDAVVALRAEGIRLSALTRSDFTLFTLEGPPEKADQMGRALATFLSQASLPRSGFEREKHAILHEVRASDSYISSPSFYERFIAVTAGAAEPCVADKSAFLNYDYDQVQSVYDRFYTQSNIKLVAQADPHTFDLDAIAKAIKSGHPASTLTSQAGNRENAKTIEVFSKNGLVELIFPIAGRAVLPEDAANAYAHQARLEIQAFIRRKYQLYTARSFVDQSIHGGWVRIEIPDIGATKAPELLEVANAAMAKVRVSDYRADPVWQAFGSQRSDKPVGTAVVAQADIPNNNWLSAVYKGIKAALAN